MPINHVGETAITERFESTPDDSGTYTKLDRVRLHDIVNDDGTVNEAPLKDIELRFRNMASIVRGIIKEVMQKGRTIPGVPFNCGEVMLCLGGMEHYMRQVISLIL